MENTKNNPDEAYNSFITGTTNEDNNDLKQQCDNLLQTSAYDSEAMSQLEKDLWYYSDEELNQLKANLLMNQIDRIEAGHNYSQTDIKNKLRQ